MTPRSGRPNWCDPCGRYHPRDWQDCAGRKPSLACEGIDPGALAEPVDWDAYNSAGLHAGPCGPAVCGLTA